MTTPFIEGCRERRRWGREHWQAHLDDLREEFATMPHGADRLRKAQVIMIVHSIVESMTPWRERLRRWVNDLLGAKDRPEQGTGTGT